MKKERRETEEEEHSDIISSLPDCMLAYILSFLPTKHAILTSILSSRWRSLWTLVPVLHLDKPTLDSIRTSTLNYILFPRNPSTLCKLCIDCPRRSFVDKCVQAAILRGVQELDLVFDLDNQTKELPGSVFFCTTLVVLKLRGHFLLNPPDPASSSSSMFPSLKTLQISHVYYANHNSLSTVLAACPLLQDLRIKVGDSDLDFLDKKADKKFNILVFVPTLKILVLDCSFLRWSFKLHINTPALEYFHFKGDLDNDVVSENLPNLFKSVLDVRRCYYLDWMLKLTNFMGPLCNIRSMELWIGTAKYILQHSSNNYYDIPMFHNLSSLKFYGDLWAMWSTWNAVQLLLCRAPKLQTLTFELNYRCCIRSFSVDIPLKKPLDVPECLSSHLTTCHYKGFSGHAMELVEQILKESKVLKTMKITFNSDLDSKEKLRIHEEIMKFPRTSQTCQIYILEHSSSNNHYDIPMFHNLSSLKFYGDLWAMWSPWNAVQLLLCRAPKLQTLTFELNYRCCIRSFSVDIPLKKPLDVPECLSSHLTTCHYKGFSGHSMELVEQILKESKVLKTMKITFNSDLDSKEMHRIHEEIIKFPRTSQTCQIVFD